MLLQCRDIAKENKLKRDNMTSQRSQSTNLNLMRVGVLHVCVRVMHAWFFVIQLDIAKQNKKLR